MFFIKDSANFIFIDIIIILLFHCIKKNGVDRTEILS